jgi:hypothetical protein
VMTETISRTQVCASKRVAILRPKIPRACGAGWDFNGKL